MRLLAPLALLLVAGCLAAPTPAAPGPGAGVALPWELLDCRYFIMDVEVPADRLETRLPEGFTLAEDGSPLRAVRGDTPTIGIEAFSCADGTSWFSTYTAVVAPGNLTLPEHLHFVMWDTVYSNATAIDALAPRGYPVLDGVVVIADLAAGPASAPATRALVEADGLGTITMTGVFPRAGSPFGGEFVEYMEAGDGSLAAWRTGYEAETARGGEATVEVPEGSWLSEVLGGTRARGNAISGQWSFTGGSIRAPI